MTTNFADYKTVVSNDMIATTAMAGPQPANSTAQQLSSEMRPAVRNVIGALRAMPPDARERQLNSGRYDNFAPEERELLNNGLRPAQVATN